jgi:regulator of CtrA degradation
MPPSAGSDPGQIGSKGESVSEPGESIAFLDGTYEEAVELTREARDYFAVQEPSDSSKLAPEARLVTSCESMRLTARLTQIMAWLLVQKAVHAGEMSREAAADECFRLGGQKVCANADSVAGDYLPPRLAELLGESHTLYTRVARLDAMLGGGGAP